MPIPNPATLTFDPKSESTSELIRKIFEKPLIRTLWIGLCANCIVDEDFNQNCYDMGCDMEKNGVPESKEKLYDLIDYFFGGGTAFAYSNGERLEELIPYLAGEKELDYVVNEEAIPK